MVLEDHLVSKFSEDMEANRHALLKFPQSSIIINNRLHLSIPACSLMPLTRALFGAEHFPTPSLLCLTRPSALHLHLLSDLHNLLPQLPQVFLKATIFSSSNFAWG